MAAFHVGPTTPTSLNGVAVKTITLPRCERLAIQARLYTTPTAHMHFRIAYATALTDTAVATAEHTLTHLGSRSIRLLPGRQAYLYVFTTDSGGTSATMGAADYVSILTGVQ